MQSIVDIIKDKNDLLGKTHLKPGEVKIEKEEAKAATGPDDRPKYFKEILFLCKTFSAAEKEKITILKAKTEKINALAPILAEFSDPKTVKDVVKQRTIAGKHIELFPYLKTLDLKNDIKCIAACIMKIIEYKSLKLKKYPEEIEKIENRLGIANQSFKTYDKKLNELVKK